jgi:hypothetical protein
MQSIHAVLTASTPAAIALRTGATPTLPLLYSRMLPVSTDSLPARLYGLRMEASAAGLRNAGATALVAVAFEGRAPRPLTARDFAVTAHANCPPPAPDMPADSSQACSGATNSTHVDVAAGDVTQLRGGGAANHLLTLRLPAGLRGAVVVTCRHTAEPLRFTQATAVLARTSGHALGA